MTDDKQETETPAGSPTLNAFKRKLATFTGHQERIAGSATDFVKGYERLKKTSPDAPELAGHAATYAAALAVLGQGEPQATAVEPTCGPETWQLRDELHALLNRLKLVEAHVWPDTHPLSPQTIAAGHPVTVFSVPALGPALPGIEQRAANAATALAATAKADVKPLSPDAEARVQAALDGAAAERAKREAAEASQPAAAEVPNPFTSALSASTVATPVANPLNPFA